MGYKRKIYRLVFEDRTLDGLEVRTRGGSIDTVVAFQALMGLGGQLLKPDADQQRGELYQLLAALLIDWNREDDDGTPIPCTLDALRGEDWDIVLAIARAWMTAVAGVSRPLGQPSTGGEPSLEESLPMEPSPPNQPN